MIFKITFTVTRKGSLLPLSYQYELSSWIYGLLDLSDSEFGKFLHAQGYINKGKRFKLFCFSSLKIRNYEVLDDRMKILSPTISLYVSFFMEQGAQALVMALFEKQSFELGDRITRVPLKVQKIESVSVQVPSSGVAKFRSLSPLVVSKSIAKENGRTIAKYLAPHDKEFASGFLDNLRNKYDSAVAHGLAEKIDWASVLLKFRVLTERPKARLIRIRAHTPQEIKVKGYVFDFELEAPPKVLTFLLICGAGEKTSQGFGFVKMIE